MMGRGRLEIKRIENPTQRQSTFYKRRDGLFKKARELAVLCDADLLLLLFSSSGKLYHYHSPSVSNVQELLRRYEVASQTRILKDQNGGENVEEVERMCEILEREIRFMRIDEGEEYTLPVLQVIEQNLEVAMKKVREEKDRKIQAEMETLHRMVKDRQLDGCGLCEKVTKLHCLLLSQLHCQYHFMQLHCLLNCLYHFRTVWYH
ncbi:MADS-box transcription factor 32 [Dendrobium catenatum]|uniref:MADS-box transcription factor 32 n=1 Tax=Dendrobium catenatum TaxID=906689 RepID=A0A2I0VHD8_9ASPA|nr:MADS-box transcription factor 32 [Dendrobium catenatum]